MERAGFADAAARQTPRVAAREGDAELPTIHFSDSFAANAEKMVSAVKSQGLEGIVAKRRDSLYEPGRRNGAWVKMRIGGGQEFVIGGYTPSPNNFDAVLIGYFQGNKLMFAARVRNGFVPALRTTVFRKFRGLETHKCPFANLPESEKGRWGEGLTAADMEKCLWLRPKLVAAIEYAEWTTANHLRYSRFVALREDKDPRQVVTRVICKRQRSSQWEYWPPEDSTRLIIR